MAIRRWNFECGMRARISWLHVDLILDVIGAEIFSTYRDVGFCVNEILE